ncbi:uncharacterized protein LOC117822893 isoform X2 [Notolabrus celidotus]|uniref:uncharacterized protein LOC117822893 isoform X2 n=1 Tax=Notolabrus celidotus TaxID=1203425 RepID=UPI0014905BDF|nr:uncharacterized protein LOC117822893 isoform X2 [Notolabrus celidotus]
MRPGGRSGRSRGGSATPLFVQEKQVSDEEESGACGVVESTEGEGKEPSLSDLMSILRANRGQQEAREARQNEVTAKQDQHLKALQHQFQLLQLEIQARTTPTPEPQFSDFDQLNVEAPTLNVQYPQSQTGSSTMTLHPTVTAGQFHSQHVPRLEKLSDDDDIEHFLITFERIAVACRWQKSDWIFHLIPLLTGKARGAYVHMDIDDSLDYDLVKSAVFAKYDINPETYRQKFRSLEVDLEESPKELYARLKELYGKWIQPKGKTIQEIGEMIILEQYLRMLSPELQVWIREHNPVSALEAAKLADVFVAARKKGQPWSYNTWETRDNRKPVQHSQQEATSLESKRKGARS